jgi:hypothetical protein
VDTPKSIRLKRTGPVPEGYWANNCQVCGFVQGDYELFACEGLFPDRHDEELADSNLRKLGPPASKYMHIGLATVDPQPVPVGRGALLRGFEATAAPAPRGSSRLERRKAGPATRWADQNLEATVLNPICMSK